MKLRKVISGGQTGADRTGLECAAALGLKTGGTAPKHWRTEVGPDPTLANYGLIQSPRFDYQHRTAQNVLNADVTLWFGYTNSPGFYCTQNACQKYNKPFHVNPSDLAIEYLLNTYEVWNIAGNRKSKNPEVVAVVMRAFKIVDTALQLAKDPKVQD